MRLQDSAHFLAAGGGSRTDSRLVDCARAAIRYLAENRLAPTPANYRRAWTETGGPMGVASGEQVAQAAVRLLAHRADPGEAGMADLAASAREERWSDALSALLQLGQCPPVGRWGRLLAPLLTEAHRSSPLWPSARRQRALAEASREYAPSDTALHAQLELLRLQWQADASDAPANLTAERERPSGPDGTEGHHQASRSLLESEPRAPINRDAVDKREWVQLRKLNAELTEVLRVLCACVETFADEGGWVQAQVLSIRDAVHEGADRRVLADARALLQHALSTQHRIVQRRREAMGALRDALPDLLRRLAELNADTSGFSEQLARRVAALSGAASVEEIADQVRGLIAETGQTQRTVEGARQALSRRSEQARTLEGEITRLEHELALNSECLLADPLTRTANRSGLLRAFGQCSASMRRSGDPMACAVLDVDDLSRVNQAFGHQGGDEALLHLARLLQSKVRPGDTVARCGGEEFVLLLPGLTDVQARELLIRVQRELTREVYLHDARRLFLTFSAGVTAARAQDTLETVLARADDALDVAKRSGKNNVALA